ncbi:MAG: hypothetical protein ABSB35_39080 [Bryobacteraceae bacterium]
MRRTQSVIAAAVNALTIAIDAPDQIEEGVALKGATLSNARSLSVYSFLDGFQVGYEFLEPVVGDLLTSSVLRMEQLTPDGHLTGTMGNDVHFLFATNNLPHPFGREYSPISLGEQS